MGHLEALASSGNLLHTALEARSALADVNLLHTLQDLGHPYGLILGNAIQKTTKIIDDPLRSPLYWSIVSAPISAGMSSDTYSRKTGNSFDGDRVDGSLSLSVLYGLLSYSSSHAPNTTAFLPAILGGFLKQVVELPIRAKELEISRGSVGLGTTCIKLATFKGEQPFVIKTPQGEPIAQINPGETLGSIHVSSQANLLRNLSPLKKVEQITGDFMDLLKALDCGTPDLNDLQQKTIDRAKSATIIGISHLVRLFGRKTGLPTWKLDVLPDLVQKFHQHDSQVVSKAFGGTRKVKPSDVEMMVITPQMRQQLVATI